MKPSRRRFLSTSAAGAITLSTVGTVQAAAAVTSSDEDRATPSPLDEDPADPVIAEVHGGLDLSKSNPSWDYGFPTFREPAVIEYEIRTEEIGDEPDVLVLDRSGFNEYKVQIGSHPVRGSTEVGLGRFGTYTFPTVNVGNVWKWLQKQQHWDVEALVDIKALDCLTEKRATQAAHRIDTGTYHIVLDWTDDVLSKPGSDDVTVDVSIRARYEKDEEAADRAIEEFTVFSRSVRTADSSLVDIMVPLAERICDQVPEEGGDLSTYDISDKALEAERTISILQLVLDILEDETGYSPPLVDSMLAETAAWARWSGQVLPVMSTVEELVDDSCAVATADSDTVTNDVENMLMSLGILVAELVMIKYGLVSRAASFAVRKAHTYLLGVVREVLGLKAYLALLRELYVLIKSEIGDVLDTIKAITQDIVDAHDFLSEEEVDDIDVVENMDEDELMSLNFDRNLHLGPFDPSPECHPDSLF
ncbi:hypothetical protein [Natronoglomus mannanivorans]|uniref:Uncharacterized protein n=1 Tax=Natronoglomus mannanivorans TaxID=2979990 RepID=A0AAP2Z3K6_9EURY|nr:hypothetical protein [Halobacteria archaeon AArc-xg1-1]